MEFPKPSMDELVTNSVLRHGPVGSVGPIVQQRRELGFFTPEEFYESVIDRLVRPSTTWLDVGCGRDLLPMNARLAEVLSTRCRNLVGVDPSHNIFQNPFVHSAFQATIECFEPRTLFDLVTLRMVAEHIEDPQLCMDALRRLTKPGGVVVIYTPYKYSPTSLAASVVPNSAHHSLKRRLWSTEECDTFPTHYRLNTARALRRSFHFAGFSEVCSWYLDDASIFHARPVLGRLELCAWSACWKLRMRYPERNILAVYQHDLRSL